MKQAIFKLVILYITSILTVAALPTEEVGNIITTENELDSDHTDCLRKDSVSCVKYKFFSMIDKSLEKHDTINIADGVTVVRNSQGDTQGAPRKLSEESSLESLIGERITGFLQTHSIKVDLKGSDILNSIASTGRSLDSLKKSLFDDSTEGRGKKKKAAKVLGPIILAVALKAAALLPLALGAIALIAGKALLIGKIALVLSAVIGLKKLLSQEKHVTYEVVAHPHHTSSHSASHSDSFGGSGYSGDVGSIGGSGHGWGRSADLAQDIAYKAHAS